MVNVQRYNVSEVIYQNHDGLTNLNEDTWLPDPGLSKKLVADQSSDEDRWGRESNYSPEWESRSKLAATLLEKPVRILDLGAGPLNLEKFLPEGSTYIPADLNPLQKHVLKIDLNKDKLPNERYDVVSMLGVFEYLFKGPEVLKEIVKKTDLLLISYCCLFGDLIDYKEQRRALGWTSDLTESSFIDLLIKMGFYHIKTVAYNDHEGCRQNIYLFCTSAKAFLSQKNIKKSIQWHMNVLSDHGSILRWYRFVEEIYQLVPEHLFVRNHFIGLALALGDKKAILSVGEKIIENGEVDINTAVPLADALRSEGREIDALKVLSKTSANNKLEMGRKSTCVNSNLLSLGINAADINLNNEDYRHPIIRPDAIALAEQAELLRGRSFESLGHTDQLILLDNADLTGDIDTAISLTRTMGDSPAPNHNINTINKGINQGWDTSGEASSDNVCDYGLLTYTTENIGDDIQSLAALQFLPVNKGIRFLNRDNLGREPQTHLKLIMNGWFGQMHSSKKDCSWPPNEFIEPVFVSFHITPGAASYILSSEGVKYLKSHEPIGCRDLYTKNLLEAHNVKAWMSGCLTATLPKMRCFSVSDQVTLVDLDNPIFRGIVFKSLKNLEMNQIVCRTHDLRVGRIYPNSRLFLAHQLLKEYATSKLVITTRLHCAVPCVAMGVPVLFLVNNPNDERFSGLGLNNVLFDLMEFAEQPEKIILSIIHGGNIQLNPDELHAAMDKICSDTYPDPDNFLDFEKFVNPKRLVPNFH